MVSSVSKLYRSDKSNNRFLEDIVLPKKDLGNQDPRKKDLGNQDPRKKDLDNQNPRKKDLPIRFWSDVSQDRSLSRRYRDNHRIGRGLVSVIKGMETKRLTDDYRFCVKTAPFVGPVNTTFSSQNPCWWDGHDTLRCVPHFYVIGASKSGTTDIFQRIRGHPRVSTNSTKEKHWLDYRRYTLYTDSLDYYSSLFNRFSYQVRTEIETQGHSDSVVGDGTPCYLFFSLYWPCYEGNQALTEPKHTNADVIHRMYSRSKIIVSLRDPVTRLYSRYLTLLHQNETSPLWFHQLSGRAVDLYTACFREWSPRHCAYNGTLYVQTQTRLQEGLYSIFLNDWLKVFPREQMLIFRFEDYVKDIPGHMDSIYRFLEVGPISNNKMAEITSIKRQNVNKKKEQMLDETKDLLQKFYAPFNLELEKLLGGSHWSWGYEHMYDL